MRWFLICLVWNLTRTAFSFPDDFNLFSGQAGPATASLLNDDLDEISGINGSDFDETFLGDDPAFNGVLPEDITFDASPAGLDTFTTLSSDPLGCLSSISRIRRRAGACSTVVEEPTQVDEDTTVADSLTRNGDIIVDQEQAAVQAVPDVTLAQNLPVNRDPPVTADESLFADMSVFQDKPIDQNTLALSDDKVVQGPTLVAQDAPVDPDEPVLEDVLPVIQDVSVEPGLLFNEDLSLDRAARVDSIQKYWCSADYGLGIDKIPGFLAESVAEYANRRVMTATLMDSLTYQFCAEDRAYCCTLFFLRSPWDNYFPPQKQYNEGRGYWCSKGFRRSPVVDNLIT